LEEMNREWNGLEAEPILPAALANGIISPEAVKVPSIKTSLLKLVSPVNLL
jgi:hypothetical protein